MGNVKWGDIPCVPVQAVRELWLASIVTRSRKGSRREIKLDCHVFPMPVNNLASWKCNRPFPEQSVVTGEGRGRLLSFWLITNYIDLSFLTRLDIFDSPLFFFLFYNIFFLVLFLFSNFVCVPRNFYDHELYILLFYFLFFVFLSSFFICAFLFFDFLPLWIILLRISYFNYPIFLAFFSLLIFFNLLLFQVLLLRINLTWWFCFSIYIYFSFICISFLFFFLFGLKWTFKSRLAVQTWASWKTTSVFFYPLYPLHFYGN